jgi:hypothetical protein
MKNSPSGRSNGLASRRRPAEQRPPHYVCPPLSAAVAACGAKLHGSAINLPENFLSSNKASSGGFVLAGLICTRCKADVKSVVRCRRCGALCPTSRIGAAMLSPGSWRAAACSRRYWDRLSSHSRDVVVGTSDRRWDQFVLRRLGRANIADATIRTAAITCLAESNPPPPTRLRRSKRRLRHNRERSHPHLPSRLWHTVLKWVI